MISIDPITPSIGAAISGLDFSQPISEAGYDAIYKALLQHLVIFIHGAEISPMEHLEFAQNFGELDEPLPYIPMLKDLRISCFSKRFGHSTRHQ